MVSGNGTDVPVGPGSPDRATPAGARGPQRSGEVAAGERILLLDRWSTIVFVVVAAAAAALPDPFELVAVPVFLALFLLGCGAFLWAYAVAIGRSRYDEVSVGGAFFLAGNAAPAAVARTLRIILGLQVVVAVAVAAVRPFTALAFAVLVPMAGLGLMALWGARYGRFPPRAAPGDTAETEPDTQPGEAPDEAPPPAQ